MRTLALRMVVIAAIVGGPALAFGRCGDEPGDAAAVAAAREVVDTTCDCAGAENHGTYVSCAADVANTRARDGLLPNSCKGVIKRCAAKSTCGKPGFVTCCRTGASGKTKCSTKSDAERCNPPAGGSACVGSFTSCCDACEAGGCTSPPSTTTSTTLQ